MNNVRTISRALEAFDQLESLVYAEAPLASITLTRNSAGEVSISIVCSGITCTGFKHSVGIICDELDLCFEEHTTYASVAILHIQILPDLIDLF